MITINKAENQSSMPANLLPDKTNTPQKIKESRFLSLPYNISNCTSRTPKNGKKRKLSQFCKRNGSSDLSPVNLINSVKRLNCSYSFISKTKKPFSALSVINKKFKHMSIKTIGNYIKQKILDMSMQLEKDDEYLSEIENCNNCNITMPSMSINKIIKKFNSGSGHESSAYLYSKKENKKKLNNQILHRKSINYANHKKEFNKNTKEKIFRKIERKNTVYDSIDDSDIFYERNKIRFHISSDSIFALIVDSSIFLCTIFDVVYTPFRVSSTVCFCLNISRKIKSIYYCIDLLYIADLIFSFFRTQYDDDLKIIIESEVSTKNYITNQFISDFLEAIPIFSIISFLCNNNYNYCLEYSFSFKQSLLLLFCYFKQLKLIKIIDIKKNSLANKILDFLSNKHNTEKKYKLFKWIILSLSAIYTFISIHIFIGHQSYPNWILSTNMHNQNYLSLYITSFYFLMATVSTVGYGDIVCSKSNLEICFQIIFLTVGVCIYSWVVSNIGNYIKNKDHAAIKCNKDEELLEEIRIAYPEMPFKLYNQILKHLKSRKLRHQKCETNILINSLPFSLRNSLLSTMYKQTTNRLKIFKNCPNSDFIIKILTNFIPLFSKKNGLLIHEGELIESIIFVNDGRLALEAAIDMEFPENSVYQYIYLKFKDINEIGGSTICMESSSTSSPYISQNFIDYKKAENILDKAINNSYLKNALSSDLDETTIGRQVGKYDYEGNFDESDFKYINIINILKNENYGSVYMFLEKPSPLSLRVKSKKAELFLLRKFNAFAISKQHWNIWKRFQRKAYLNMVSVKNLTIKIIKDYCKNYNIIPIQPKPKSIGGITLRDFDNSPNNKDFTKSYNKTIIKSLTNYSNNNKEKIDTFTTDKEPEKLLNKEKNNDLTANINKVLNNKKNDNINENKNQNKCLDPNIEINKKINNKLNENEHSKKEENPENLNISTNKINQEDQNSNTKNTNISINKSNFSSINNNLNGNNRISSTTVTKKKISCFNPKNVTSDFSEKKYTNFEQSQSPSHCAQNKSKKGLTFLSSGMFSLGNTDKKTETNANEKTENKSEYAFTFNSQANQKYKSSNILNFHLFNNKKKSPHKKNSSFSSNLKENKQKNRLNNIGKIRLRFVRKLTKKIKLLKAEKKRYKTLSKSLTHDLNEFVRKQTTKVDTTIKNIKTLDDTENKEIIYDIEYKKKNRISNQNNIINNITVQNNNKFLMEIPEFSSSESESSEEVSSNTHSRSFDLNEISISSPIRFMCKSRYKNLNDISLGYYAKSKKLRKSVRNMIKGFLSIKKKIMNEEQLKNNKKEIIYKKQKTNLSKSDSLIECPFHVYTGKISENEKRSNDKSRKNSIINSYVHNISNDMKQFNSIRIYKKYRNDENIENIINDDSDNNDSNDKNCYTFVISVPKDQDEGNTNIIKLQNMNYLSISSSRQAVYNTYNKNKKRISLEINNLKEKICNNTEYEHEHIFANNDVRGIMKKSCSANEESNLIKINNINSLYIKNNAEYLLRKKMKVEDVDESINNKRSNNYNANNKKGETKSLINSYNCYIY